MSACTWMAAQSRRLDLPCGAGEPAAAARAFVGPDNVERCAQWVASTGRRISWPEAAEHFGWNRYHAMRMLREGAQRGLLVRIKPQRHRAPDLFEGPHDRAHAAVPKP